MIIRIAKETDIPGMIELLKQVGQVHHGIRPDIFRNGCQKYDETALAELLKDGSRPIFIAAEGNAVLGYCFCILRAFEGESVMTDRKELYIDDLCVDENHRGHGIAKALYSHVTDYAKTIGCTFITLNVWSGNDSAMKFYKNAGLTPRSITMEMKLC
ncbi:MAG: GNAT family N-acetyltransferase [Oscillospiraceae bacterium]|nr:GNAT family N-acetyltransferase [Oscillospiraceae bacterium]